MIRALPGPRANSDRGDNDVFLAALDSGGPLMEVLEELRDVHPGHSDEEIMRKMKESYRAYYRSQRK